MAKVRLVKRQPPRPAETATTTIPASVLADMMLDAMGIGRMPHGGGECRIRGRVDVAELPDRTTVRHTTQRTNPKRGTTAAGKAAHRMPYGPGRTW